MSGCSTLQERVISGRPRLFGVLGTILVASGAAAGAPDQDDATKVEEVVVTGIRESLQSAAEIKRNSPEVVDSITAEDIGKLPDPNVAETMTRIPGVQGYRYGGEGASPVGVGSGLTIRGLSGQTASQVDGRSYFTAGNREFNIEGAIPGMISGIDVYKNPSAEHIEGGIGGLVNIRTRRPLDFAGLTFSAAANLRYNGLSEDLKPELFALFSNRWETSGGGEFGFLVAANVQESHNRSDSNPGNGGTSLRRPIRADAAEYATTAGANQAYAGRSDVWYLADVANPLALTSAERANLVSTATQQAPIFEEDILRTRRGFNAALQWKPTDDLMFYAESNYNYYLYHQQYRFLFANDTRTVQSLASSPYELTEGLANRNANGGADEVLAGQRLDGGTFLDSTLSSAGGDENHPYETAIYAAGFDWSGAENLDVRFDLAYVSSEQRVDNRSVNSSSAPGLTWDVARDLTDEPHGISFSGGPALDAPTTWMFRDYGNGNRAIWQDKGIATRLDATYKLDAGFLKALKVGARWAVQEANFHNYSYGGRPLTTNGLALAADGSNGILFSTFQDLTEAAPGNWMDGEAGYAGGYLVYAPQSLLGDNVRNRFPLAGIPAEGSLPENIAQRRFAREKTLAAYLQGEFGFFGDRVTGNAGVRVVRADLSARAMVANVPGPGFSPNSSTNSYTDVLPSLNLVGHLTDELQLRFGFGKQLTRPSLDALNPSIAVNSGNGTGSRGNPELDPLTAESYDLSLEWYFSSVGYLSAGIFDKEIKGFFTGVTECETVPNVPGYPGAPSTPSNSCPDGSGQYFVTRTVNSEPGYARGVEVAGQTFFDFLPGGFRHFGVQGSYAHVETENPVRFTTNGPIFDVPQAFQSDDNYSLALLFDNGTLSSRLVYTYRSDFVLFGVSANPIDGRYVKGYGLVDFSLNYKVAGGFDVSFNASNLTNQGANRFVGEPGAHATDFERQHYMNGRIFGLGVRYRFEH